MKTKKDYRRISWLNGKHKTFVTLAVVILFTFVFFTEEVYAKPSTYTYTKTFHDLSPEGEDPLIVFKDILDPDILDHISYKDEFGTSHQLYYLCGQWAYSFDKIYNDTEYQITLFQQDHSALYTQKEPGNRDPTTIIVDINGGGDYTNIQDGIDNSQDGDTVLVYPGTYVENIDFNGKSIVLASLELITGDASYIDSTIIGGGQQSSCIRLHNSEQNAVIQGFSITNGIGYDHIHHAVGRVGGGIAIENIQMDSYITNCKIFNNSATEGGGIYVMKSKAKLSGTKIYTNYSSNGGGMFITTQSTVIFDNINLCNIYNNYSGIGSDLHLYNTGDINVIVDTFTVMNPFGYFVVYSESGAYTGNVMFDIQNAWTEEIDHDLYVAIDGDDNNTGLNPNEPLRTIAWALHKIKSDSLNSHTVFIEDGIYSNELNDQIFPIGLKSYTSIMGNSKENTILIADSSYSLMLGAHFIGEINICNLNLRSDFNNIFSILSVYNGDIIYLSDLIIQNNYSPDNFISDFNSNKLVTYNKITYLNNTAEKVAGINHEKGNAYVKDCCFENNHSLGTANESYLNVNFRLLTYEESVIENSTFLNNSNMSNEEAPFCFSGKQFYSPEVYIRNCLFANNETPYLTTLLAVPADPIVPDSLDVQITNCTFADNKSSLSTAAFMGEIDITNTIFYDSTDYEIYLDDWSYYDMYATLNIKNCDIKNGQNGILNMHPYNTVNWLEGNINQDPLFIGGNPLYYELSSLSPCINAGTGDTAGLHLPPTDLAGNPRITGGRIDIGAYEWRDVSVDEPINEEILSFYVNPNPFIEGTTIVLSLKNLLGNDNVEVSIYNIRGQLVRRFDNEDFDTAPYTSIFWSGTDERGKQVAPGTYLYKLEYNGNAVVRKMVLLR